MTTDKSCFPHLGELPLQSDDMETLRRVYVASKSKYGPMWQRARAEYEGKIEINATWIDEYEDGATEDWPGLWNRCIHEAGAADFLVAYHEPGEEWKGAFIEIGAALAHRTRILLVGDPPGSWKAHPFVRRFISVYDALDYAWKGPL